MYGMYIAGIRFPVTPGSMTIKVKSQNKTITLINEGEVNLVKTPGLSEIIINELLLPSIQKYPFAVYEGGKFKGAKYFLDKLEAWKKKKKPVAFKLSRTTPDNRNLLWDTDFDVTIEDYEIIEDAEKYGMDICVKLTMKQYRNWGAKKVKIKKKNGKNKISANTLRPAKEPAKKYTVKKGDTLLKIARKQLGDGSKRKGIYKLNKKTIEAAAKKHGRKSSSNGYWIYPGTKLKLPGGEESWGKILSM